MANEIVINEGRPGALAAADLAAGDPVVLDSNGKWAACAAGDRYVAVMFTGAATGVRGAAEMRKGHEVRVKVDGSGTAIAVGDLLMPGTGKLVSYVATADIGTNVAVAVAKQASSADGDLIKVVLL